MSAENIKVKDLRSSLRIVEGIEAIDRAYEIASEGFGVPNDTDLQQDVEQHIREAELQFSVLDAKQKMVGYALYNAFEFDEGRLLYLAGAQVTPEAQGQGATKALSFYVASLVRPNYVGFRTQSLRVYQSLAAIAPALYPALDGSDIPDEIQSVGDQLATEVGGAFPISQGFYSGRSLYGEAPTHDLDSTFYRMIDVDRGDALLCVGALGKMTHK